MNSIGMMIQASLAFHKDANSDTLPDIEDVLILQPVRCSLLFLAVAVEIEYVDFIEALHEAAAHSSERGIIEIAVIRDESQNTMPSALNLPLCKANEFDVVVAQPFCLGRLFQFRISFLIGFNQASDPLAFINGMACIGWIAQHYHHWIIVFPLRYLVDSIKNSKRLFTVLKYLLQCVGQVNAQ